MWDACQFIEHSGGLVLVRLYPVYLSIETDSLPLPRQFRAPPGAGNDGAQAGKHFCNKTCTEHHGKATGAAPSREYVEDSLARTDPQQVCLARLQYGWGQYYWQ